MKLPQFDKLSTFASASPQVARTIEEAQTISQKVANTRLPFLEKILKATSSLIDPAKLAILKAGSRSTNLRLNKLMKQLHVQERAGIPPRTALDNALNEVGTSRKLIEHYYDPVIMRESVLNNYDFLKRSGVFDEKSNLESLARGGAL